MNLVYKNIALVSLLLFTSTFCYSQGFKKEFQILYDIADSIKQLNSYQYEYELTVEYSDSSIDMLRGKVIVDVDNGIFINMNDSFEVYCSKEWFCRVLHSEKQVIIFRLDKRYSEAAKDEFVNSVFSSQISKDFIDSFILKYAQIDKYKLVDGLLFLDLVFPKEIGVVSKIQLQYDTVNNLPVELTLHTKYPVQNNYYSNSEKVDYINQRIKCMNYSRSPMIKGMSNLFYLKNNKIVLKMYKKYELHTL